MLYSNSNKSAILPQTGNVLFWGHTAVSRVTTWTRVWFTTEQYLCNVALLKRKLSLIPRKTVSVICDGSSYDIYLDNWRHKKHIRSCACEICSQGHHRKHQLFYQHHHILCFLYTYFICTAILDKTLKSQARWQHMRCICYEGWRHYQKIYKDRH